MNRRERRNSGSSQAAGGEAAQLLAQAIGLFQQGNLLGVEALCGRVLEKDPRHFDALHLLGLVHLRQGAHAAAVEWIMRALAVRKDAQAFGNAGVALRRLNRHNEALHCFDNALALEPNQPDVLNNRGNLLRALQRDAEALVNYERALDLKPQSPEMHNNRGLALTALNRHADAVSSFERALALKPDYAEALSNRGISLSALDRHDEAIDSLEQALTMRPDYPEARSNLGVAYNNRGLALSARLRHEEALISYERAMEAMPDYADAINNRGNALNALGRTEEAIADYGKALALKPDYAEALANRGAAFHSLNRHAEAFSDYERALALAPEYGEAHWNRGLALLREGNLREGWRGYEWRWKRKNAIPPRQFACPRWPGNGGIGGKRLLVWAEQGLGDTIQFCRYVPVLAAAGAKVVLEVQAPLKPLLATLGGVSALVAQGDALPDCDFEYPLLSLPYALNTELATIPGSVPYLSAQEDKVAAWREALGAGSGPRIGIVCSGNPEHANDRNRSMPLRHYAGLLETGARVFLLQKDLRAADEAYLSATPGIVDLRPRLTDFAETAAAVACMDLVISVDTSVAHLAGAMGRPVWVLLSFSPDWRWLLDREDNPWYPTARLFRQPGIGEWDSVMTQVLRALAGLR